LNFITITGNLGRDAEKRVLQDGTSVLSFSVADSSPGKDKPALWWECGLFGKRADTLEQYMRKGQQVTVVGQVSEREYQAKDGTTKKAMSVRVTDVALQGGKRDDDGGTSYAPKSQSSARPAEAQAERSAPAADLDDDIPF
jgi:single-strand DNA-binding protein